MKLNKIKIARLSDNQAMSVNGGGTGESTQKNFTCCWCTGSGPTNVGCPSTLPADRVCNTTVPVSPGF
ncbi:hypothetical protein [Flavobacterium sp. ABG]|uniref:hypothetical protein n=1 Tax=Flavobacterium sp. ABG TaxID=1423322 RepID=UPI000649C881|nr:hypothetical protein [Flavobacterium sp. ABG]KLT70292.1 hypothetical protein AB674_08800 [Flavobacterium sp. ABG]